MAAESTRQPVPTAAASALAEQIEALRGQGAGDVDAATLHLIEAMWRRAQRLHGLARTKVEQRLQQRVHALQRRLRLCARRTETSAAPVPTPSPFAALLQRLDGAAGAPGSRVPSAATGVTEGEHRPMRVLKARHYFRRTWLRLSVEQRLALALRQAPQDAGPLNAHHLLLQTLLRLRQLAPHYLHGMLNYSDVLLVLEQSLPARAGTETGSATAAARRRGRTRRGRASGS